MKIFNIASRQKAARHKAARNKVARKMAARKMADRKIVARNHFSELPVLLDQIRLEICEETSALRASGDRICVSAAFAFDSMENGEILPARVDSLERDLVANHGQLALLEQQERCIAAMRSLLDEFISGQQDSGQFHGGDI